MRRLSISGNSLKGFCVIEYDDFTKSWNPITRYFPTYDEAAESLSHIVEDNTQQGE